MIKSIFVSAQQLDGIEDSGANHLIVTNNNLDKDIWHRLKMLNVDLGICINSFGPDGCPANRQAKEKLFDQIKGALLFKPKEIWIDHFRFDGHWEAIEGSKILGVHQPCEFCGGKSRVEILEEAAKEVMNLVSGKARVGYFAVPLKSQDAPEMIEGLGQNHLVIGKVFDMSSPMLYQQMIKKPTSYISEYVKWLADKTQKPILPIIQVKSMPDDLKDTITEGVMTSEFQEAISKPSIGVCFFWWAHVLEKNKAGIIKKLFHSVG